MKEIAMDVTVIHGCNSIKIIIFSYFLRISLKLQQTLENSGVKGFLAMCLKIIKNNEKSKKQ
ncbi:MAG: hypothetical protein J6V78_00280 [Clostridia bacterium]|nr:hypothetical protein [Clostridia bacterium]